jgi:hypothetical protein
MTRYFAMKSYYTPPQNHQFFQSYYRLTPTLRLMGYLAQVITALAEIGISYRLILSSVAEVFPEYATPVAYSGAIMVTVFLEVGLRRFLPFAFRAVLYRRFSGLHLLISVPVLLITAALIVALGFLSVQGSHEVVRQIAPDPEMIPEDPILLRSEEESDHVLQLWRSDSALLEQQYLSLQRGVEARYRPKIEKNRRWQHHRPPRSAYCSAAKQTPCWMPANVGMIVWHRSVATAGRRWSASVKPTGRLHRWFLRAPTDSGADWRGLR